MGRIALDVVSRVTTTEKPYWQIQAYPDGLKYDIQRSPLGGKVSGTQKYIGLIQENLQQLNEARAISEDGPLYRRFLAFSSYHYSLDDNNRVDPMLDMLYLTKLEDFQRLACTGSSFANLPGRAAKAAFWDTSLEAVLPRISLADFKAQFPKIW
jgi:hypothetical protein